MKKIMILTLSLLTGCANTPNYYGQYVRITGGLYKGERGRLMKDCSGFENYRIQLLSTNKDVCIRIWHLEDGNVY